MEVTIGRPEIHQIINAVQNAVDRKATRAVLTNILLTAGEGQLRASGSDLELTIISKAPAQVTSPGSIAVNADIIANVVKELPEGNITLKVTEGERLEIGAGKSKTRIVCVSAEEYPGLPGVGLQVGNTIAAPELCEMISKTVYAVSQDEGRFHLTGVLFEDVTALLRTKEPTLRMVATDGHRLAIVTRPVKGLALKQKALVPKKALLEVRRILEGHDKEIGIDFNERFMLIDSGTTKIASREIDGDFPDYQQALPGKASSQAILNNGEYSRALKLVSLLVSEKSKGVRLEFNTDSLAISSSSPELGDAREVLPIQYSGKPVVIGFNARYLIDIAATLQDSDNLIIELNGEEGPGKFLREGDNSYMSIVMPMRLPGE
jgi:DNA polymerase-3 subunit beta